MSSGLALAKIYKIYSAKTDRVYIGSTCVPDLRIRLSQHMLDYWKYKAGESGHRLASFDLFDIDEAAKIELVEKFPTDSKIRLLAREQYWIDRAGSLAVNRGVAFSRGEFHGEMASPQASPSPEKSPPGISISPPRGRSSAREKIKTKGSPGKFSQEISSGKNPRKAARESTPMPARETFSAPQILVPSSRRKPPAVNSAPARTSQATKPSSAVKTIRPKSASSQARGHSETASTSASSLILPAETRCPCGGKISTNPLRHAGSQRHRKYILAKDKLAATQGENFLEEPTETIGPATPENPSKSTPKPTTSPVVAPEVSPRSPAGNIISQSREFPCVDVPAVPATSKVTCPCGATVLRSSFIRHIGTRQHAAGLAITQKI